MPFVSLHPFNKRILRACKCGIIFSRISIFLIFKNMIEDLIEIFIKEFQKYNMRSICVLGSW